MTLHQFLSRANNRDSSIHSCKRHELPLGYLTRTIKAKRISTEDEVPSLMPRISHDKALSKIEEYLGKVDKLQTMLHDEGNELREELNISIRTLIPLALENGEKKVKAFDSYVNWFIAVAGERKSATEEQKEYERRLKDTKKFLQAWKDELEMTGDAGMAKSDATTTRHPKRIFIVHGRDEKAKLELENLLTRLNLEPIILHRMPDKGRTVIEKFEGESKGISYAFVLLTPDDECFLSDEETGNQKSVKRARQNVVLEMGFFIGSLGRERVCPIYKKGVEIPSDITGVLYKRFNDSVEELYGEIRKELVTAGYKLPAY